MDREIKIDGLSIPASWKLLTSGECREAAGKLSSAQRQWLKTHEHFHVYQEILAAVRGNCIFKVEDRILELHEGEMILIDSRERHTSGHLPDKHAVYWWCLLAPGKLEMLLWRHNRLDSISTLAIGDFSRFLGAILNDLSDPDAKSHAEYELVHIMSGLLCNFVRQDLVCADPQKKTFQDAAMQKILAYIDSIAAMSCSLNSLASMAGYSRTHFQRLFHEYTGTSFRDYLEKKKLDRYHRLCEKKNYSKKEISDLLGFSSTAALNHWEKKLKGKHRI